MQFNMIILTQVFKKYVSLFLIILLLMTNVACGGGGGTDVSSTNNGGDSSSGSAENQTRTVKRLVYNFSDATIVLSHSDVAANSSFSALVDDSSAANTVSILLAKVKTDGTIEAAVSIVEEEIEDSDEETADEFELNASRIRTIVNGPSGEVYIIYQESFLYDGVNTCLIFEYTVDDGVECVDTEIETIDDPAVDIQFNGNGDLFYYSFINDNGTLEYLLRKKSRAGEITTITNDYIGVYSFSPLDDGSVVVYGKTSTTSTNFLRHYAIDNSVSDLLAVSSLQINKLWGGF